MQKNLRRWQRATGSGGRRDPGTGGKPCARSTGATCESGTRISDDQHQMPRAVTRKYSELITENLNVAAIMRGSHAPKAHADAGMGDIKQQLFLQGPVGVHSQR